MTEEETYLPYVTSNQEGADCQLVTAMNASILLHGKRLIKPKGEEYMALIDKIGCVAGAAINIQRAHPKLKIKLGKKYKCWSDIDWTAFPLELQVWSMHYGYHSVAVVDYEPHCEAVRVLNFKCHTTLNGWIFLEKLRHYVATHLNSPKSKGHLAHSFRKRGSK